MTYTMPLLYPFSSFKWLTSQKRFGDTEVAEVKVVMAV